VTAPERDEYARQIALLTAQVVEAVHRHDHKAAWHWAVEIAALPAPEGFNPFVSALALLAAQVPPDSTLDARLAWCHPDVVAACGGAA
jgi:hypothetical protein